MFSDYVQDMELRLNTPQLNRLLYLVGRDLARYVRWEDVPQIDYDGEFPYAILSDTAPSELAAVTPDHILRSGDEDEIEHVRDLRRQLDDLWHG